MTEKWKQDPASDLVSAKYSMKKSYQKRQGSYDIIDNMNCIARDRYSWYNELNPHKTLQMTKKQEYLGNWEILKSEEEQTKPKEESDQAQISNL